ncbi:trypsin-like peptidase domain-containing protein [Bartonella sp. HY406]|uniref:trypsin-like peptidase domain-containing protein n=1 Tax=Bartonella sp. HY406 TaxID=2979331 RepID=UPI0021CA1E48|nr:trypsin-like peptidase domain-containing protein [Bartonella sp. HY406]UXN02909.1 trypsin-like peptidase domain-containing protein [Bartonella sp. HY406]
MDNFNCFLKSNNLQEFDYACFEGKAVVHSFDEVEAYFSRHSAGISHFIFAKPFISETRDNSGDVVSWYCNEHGNAITWLDLDEGTKARVAQELQKEWQNILTIFAATPLLPIVERWFNIADINQDLLLVANRPILTNWGLLPKAISKDEKTRINHFNNGLGHVIGVQAVLPFHSTDSDLSTPLIGGQTVAANDGNQHQGSQVSQNSQNHNPDATSVHETHQYVTAPPSRGGFLLPLIFSGVFLFLIALLLLVYFLPASNLGVKVSSTEKDEAIALLETRRDELKKGLSGFSCPIPEAGPQSAGRTQGGGSGNNGDGVISAIDPNLPLPDISGALVVPTSGPIAHAEKATVLIMVEDDSDEGGSMGSGFFINETDILTNLHVVGEAQNVKIINKELGKTIDAKVVARSRGEAQIGAPDFAVLRVSGARAPAVLAIAGKTAKGESVIAAGFPGIIMETDTVFHRLLRGDATAAPEMAVTQGMVTTFQQGIEGLELMLHTAAISGGNSGGPLIDYCGRAVGVNTFLRSGGSENSPLSFAQRTSTLTSFLKRSNVAFKFDDTQCNPQAQQPAVAQAAPTTNGEGATNGEAAPNSPAAPNAQPNNATPNTATPDAAQPSTQPSTSGNAAPTTGNSNNGAANPPLSPAPSSGGGANGGTQSPATGTTPSTPPAGGGAANGSQSSNQPSSDQSTRPSANSGNQSSNQQGNAQ